MPLIVFTVKRKRMSQRAATCPHCARPLPGTGLHGPCPFCHQELAAVPATPPLTLNPGKTNWRRFFIILFIPPVGNFIALACDADLLTLLFTLGGSLWSGIVCSRMIMARLGVTGRERSWLAILVQSGMLALAFFLCFVGCSFGSNAFNSHR